MTSEHFEKIWIDQQQIEKSMLLERAAAYATKGDRLGNFYAGAELNDEHPLRYGFGLVTKQIIALRDLIKKIDKGEGAFNSYEMDKVTEYTTDIRNYMILVKALYMEHQEKAFQEESK